MESNRSRSSIFTDYSVWFLGDPSHCWSSPHPLLAVLAARDACACPVHRFSFPQNAVLILFPGQRIVPRLCRTNFCWDFSTRSVARERGEGDALSRVSVDSSVVGER
jgi:hypothetical protein